MRLSDYVGTVLRDIRRQPVRSLLTVAALILSSSLFVSLVALGLGTRTAITEQLGRDTTANSVIVSSSKAADGGLFGNNVQLASAGSVKLDENSVETLGALPGVRTASPRMAVYQFKEFSVEGYQQTFVAKTTATDATGSKLLGLRAGKHFTADVKPQVILGSGYVEALGAELKPSSLVGKTVQIQTVSNYRGKGAEIPEVTATREEQLAFAKRGTSLEARVVGITDSASSDSVMYIPMGWAHDIFSVQARTTTGITTTDVIDKIGFSNIVVQASSSSAVRPVTAQIEAMGYGISSRQQQIDQVNQLSIVMWIVLGSIAVISMISAALGIVNTMLMTVSEQRYAIGVWRACGATKSLITRLFLLQATVLGVVGGLVGTVIGRQVSAYVNNKIAGLLKDQGL
ncbi:MAG: ABC transporter permease, partial [Propionibacteriaceae bacterium]